jgi:transposase
MAGMQTTLMEGKGMIRHGLTDDQWEAIADVFPPPAKTGRPPSDRRKIVEGILWIVRTGAPWRDLPEAFGPWQTVWDLFDKWNADGTLDEILLRLKACYVDVGQIDEELWCIDGTTIRAARCAGGGGKKGIPRSRPIMR